LIVVFDAVSVLPGYVRPEILDSAGEGSDDGPLLDASDARHPVLENLLICEFCYSEKSVCDV
jgi:hypothetical protein